MNSYSRNYSDHHACAHAWAHQHVYQGYSSNFFFDGPTIYSYGRHFPIATLYDNLVFFTLSNYSRSTAKHKSRAHSAVSHMTIVYVEHMPVILEDGSLSRNFIDQNINTWTQQMLNSSTAFQANPRKRSLLNEMNQAKCRLRAFISTLNLDMPREYTAILEDPTLSSISAFALREQQIRLETERKLQKTALSSFKVQLKLWEKGKQQYLSTPHPLDPNLAYLRIAPDGRYIETSKQVRIPFHTANGLYQYIQKILSSGSGELNYEIMGFAVKEISARFIVAGCHKVPISQVRKMAKLLGWH